MEQPAKTKNNYGVLILVIILSCLFCGWPNFHPEEYIGVPYHWALDMFFHSSFYFVITILLCWLLLSKTKSLFFYLSMILFSFLLELIQLWIPKRSFTLLDITSNIIGITAGFFLYRLVNKHWLSKK